MKNRRERLIAEFSQRYTDELFRLRSRGPRSYGFEYEFLPTRMLTSKDVDAVARLLVEIGFAMDRDMYQMPNGVRVAFEPGGQIEYCSPPMYAQEQSRFDELIDFIRQVNTSIQEKLGIEYVGTDFMPERAQAPLCLTTDRYVKLHDRLSKVGTRGLEMMKATASIHLHAMISDFDEILPLFKQMCRLSSSDEFKMSHERRDIWQHTDTTRCGTPPCCFEEMNSSEILIKRLIFYALHAHVLGEDVAFVNSSDLSFEAFLYHMTTLFTDVRFNLKGPTLELRTMDSMPMEKFRSRWNKFVTILETI